MIVLLSFLGGKVSSRKVFWSKGFASSDRVSEFIKGVQKSKKKKHVDIYPSLAISVI